jgi:twitching motility protein PilT
MTAAETGHLVLSGLHCRGAASAVERIVDLFPGDQQVQVRRQLADSLRAVAGVRWVHVDVMDV